MQNEITRTNVEVLIKLCMYVHDFCFYRYFVHSSIIATI